MIQLLSIADLEQTQQSLLSCMAAANSLYDTYMNYIEQDQDESYSYTVHIHGAKERAPGIHASEISGCKRIPVYSLMGTPRVPNKTGSNPNMLMRFRIGHAVHAMLQNDWHRIAARSGGYITFEDEVKINPKLGGVAAEWRMHSSCDGVITLWAPNGAGILVPVVRVGIEIKTASHGEFDKLRGPKSDHEEQTCFYMRALDLPLMWVFYYNKSNSSITPSKTPFLYSFDRSMWEDKLEMRFAEVMDMADRGELPPRTEGMQCSWCAYAHTCQPPKVQRILQSQTPIQISPGMRNRTARKS